MAMIKRVAVTRFRAKRDELRDPLLSVLTLLLILFLFVIVPLHAAGTISAEGYGFIIVLLLASCVLMQSTRWVVLVVLFSGVALAAAAVVLRSRSPSAVDILLEAIAWVIIDIALIFVIAGAVFAPGRVTYHRVNGAVLLYLTIGMTFVGLYTLVGLWSPNAFSGLVVYHEKGMASSVIYFSFVTLTSVGYGDIAPVHPMARALANLEGIIGQLFPATLLARLVTLELQDRHDRLKGKD
ncbi:Ion transport 2 domain protein [Methylocella tundrae]|uniref:Ion transport 2 domain protein n=1 Tax=Methylocella tundrae TaxID=227605 RepID=A0A8B6M5J4_METTU|nr:potassium channel family protein [Methylocella tundrae]VTZ26416.1 Ion transport 2 domain protein [Methylocella tundrae]VTZ49649.1 Ion transport 2 domain protein [Methylocella tundrae]